MSLESVLNSTTAQGGSTSMTEAEHLLKKAALGDIDAQTKLYNSYFERVYRFIYFRVSHQQTAEDLTEEVFIKVFSSLSSLSNTQSFEGWFFRIARNKIIDHYRSRKQNVNIDELENLLEYEQNIIDTANTSVNHKRLLILIKQLPIEQQIILKLKFFDELENHEIAEMLNKSEVSVRVTQHRAISKLKQLFGPLT